MTGGRSGARQSMGGMLSSVDIFQRKACAGHPTTIGVSSYSKIVMMSSMYKHAVYTCFLKLVYTFEFASGEWASSTVQVLLYMYCCTMTLISARLPFYVRHDRADIHTYTTV